MTLPEQTPPPIPQSKHSGMGISSFAISITAGLAMFGLFVVAGIMESTTPGGIDERSASAIIIGFLIIAMLTLDLVALGLGIAGILQKERKRLFAVLGTIFASVTVACTILLMVVGLAMKRP